MRCCPKTCGTKFHFVVPKIYMNPDDNYGVCGPFDFLGSSANAQAPKPKYTVHHEATQKPFS